MLQILVCLLLLLISCGENKRKVNPASADIRLEAKLRYEYLLTIAPLDEQGYIIKLPPIDNPATNDGDVMLFAGINCAMGVQVGCTTAIASFDGERFWRSPRRAVNRNFGWEDSFSRDMMNGVLFYLIATKDQKTAKAYQTYIEAWGKLCQDATDNRCSLLPTTLGMMESVWRFIGLEPSFSMKTNKLLDEAGNLAASASVSKGYQQELILEWILLKRIMGQNNTIVQTITERIYKGWTNNLLAHYLYKGADEEFYNMFLAQSPDKLNDLRYDWAFAKDYDTKNTSMVWDYIFIYNLALKGY